MINPLLVLKTEQALNYLHAILAQWKVLGEQQSLAMLHPNEMLDLVHILLDCWRTMCFANLGEAVQMLRNEERYLRGEVPVTTTEKELHERFLCAGDRANWELPLESFRELDEKYWPRKK